MRSARALVLLGILATALSAVALIASIVVLVDHNLHPPHVDADLLIGLVGLIVVMAALGGSINLVLVGLARRRMESTSPSSGSPQGGGEGFHERTDE